MVDIKITKLNESTLQLECSNNICGELSNYFSAFVDNYKWMPAYKAKTWDGRVRAFDSRKNQLPIGLLYRLLEFCKKGEYTYEKKFSITQPVDYQEFLDFVKSLEIPFELRDYQLKAAYDAVSRKMISIASSTSSGKTAIIYVIVRWLESKGLKVLLCTPSIQLVEQAFNDFYEYGWTEVEEKCCRVYSGHKRLVNRLIWIGTWQSLNQEKKTKTIEDKEEYKSYDACIFDEHHLSAAATLSAMGKALINSSYRIGFSGSYPDEGTANWLTITGITGQIVTYSTYKSLQEEGHIADFKIITTILQYPMDERLRVYNLSKNSGKDDEDTKTLETKRYAVESEYVYNLKSRNEFILKLSGTLTGNTLILFKNKEAHGIPLYNELKNRLSDKICYYIDGDLDIKERVKIQHKIEAQDNIILVASVGTTSTGISIKNLHNLIFVSGTKSKIKTIQSVGRLLRLNHNKDTVKIFDIVDDLSFKDTKKKIYFKNYSLKHYQDRLKIYNDNEFKVEKVEYKIKGN